jgi:hypothetical protein
MMNINNKGNIMGEPSNQELLERIEQLEVKMDRLTSMMEQASGAWFFVKLVASVVMGIAVAWNSLQGWFQR